MRIIIVSGNFYPGNSPRAFRTTELVKELSKRKHEVIVYIPKTSFDYSSFCDEYPCTIKSLGVRWSDINANTSFKSKYRRIVNLTLEYPNIQFLFSVPRHLKNETSCDLLITIAQPHPLHWGMARFIKRHPKFAKTWVADCGDPYMLAASVDIKHPFYFKWFEKSWCRLCDYISVPTPGAVNGYYPEFRNKIVNIPQAFDFENIKLEKYVPNDVPTFAYCGRFVKNNTDPRPIMDFLLTLDFDFRFIAYTIQEGLFADYRERMGDRLVLKPFKPRDEIITEMSKMDFLLYIPYKDAMQAPSKMIDYTLSGRPILSISSYNIDKDKFLRFLKGDYSDSAVIDLSPYNIKNATDKFLSLCK